MQDTLDREREDSDDSTTRLPERDTVIKIKTTDGRVFDYNFSKQVRVDPGRLSEEGMSLAATRHYVGHLLAEAEKRVEIHKLTIQRWASKLRQDARAKHPKLTEGDKEDIVNSDETLYALKMQMIELQETVNRLWSVVSALRYKRDMLQTISANVRSMRQDSDLSEKDLAALSQSSNQSKFEQLKTALNL